MTRRLGPFAPLTALVIGGLAWALIAPAAQAVPSPACRAPSPATGASLALPAARVGRPYDRPIVQGGEPPYQYTADSGPPEALGLALTPTGRLSGTPRQPGTFAFTVVVHGRAGCAAPAQPYRLRVLAAPGR